MKFVPVLTAVLLLSLPSLASRLNPLTPQELSEKSSLVLIGRVLSTEFDAKEYKGTMTIRVEAVIKGKTGAKTLKIPVDKNPLSGFDVMHEKRDVAVFFIRSVEGDRALLTSHGMSAVFPKDYLQ